MVNAMFLLHYGHRLDPFRFCGIAVRHLLNPPLGIIHAASFQPIYLLVASWYSRCSLL